MPEDTRAVRTVETGERKDRVLIVEDEDNARKGYEQLLQRWGYEVLGGASAGEVSVEEPPTSMDEVSGPGASPTSGFTSAIGRTLFADDTCAGRPSTGGRAAPSVCHRRSPGSGQHEEFTSSCGAFTSVRMLLVQGPIRLTSKATWS